MAFLGCDGTFGSIGGSIDPFINGSGGGLSVGTVVTVGGWSSSEGLHTVTTVSGLTDFSSGIVVVGGDNGERINVIYHGPLDLGLLLDTSGATVGDYVYFTAGGVLTLTPGSAIIGFVTVAHASQGRMFVDSAAGAYLDPLTTEGDIVIHNGTSTTRLAIGTAGQVLTVVGGAPAWENVGQGILEDQGDILRRGSSNAEALALGATNTVVSSDGTDVVYQSLSDLLGAATIASFTMDEVASVLAPSAGDGRWWVKNDTPNVPMFTDDAGTDHSLLPGLVGYAFGSLNSTGSTTTNIPLDDTIPASGEGAQIMSVSYTPTSTSNKIIVLACVLAGHTNSSPLTASVTLFKDLGLTALAGTANTQPQYGVGPHVLGYSETATSTLAQTWKIRGGENGTGTFRWNGFPFSGGRIFGDIPKSFMLVLEVRP